MMSITKIGISVLTGLQYWVYQNFMMGMISDSEGNWLLTDTERLELVKQEMSLVEQRAESAEQRAKSAEQRAASLAQRLRELGIDI
jgi:hypothetical protein